MIYPCFGSADEQSMRLIGTTTGSLLPVVFCCCVPVFSVHCAVLCGMVRLLSEKFLDCLWFPSFFAFAGWSRHQSLSLSLSLSLSQTAGKVPSLSPYTNQLVLMTQQENAVTLSQRRFATLSMRQQALLIEFTFRFLFLFLLLLLSFSSWFFW